MIFVTVGSQMPFDRMLTSVDAWAAAHPGTKVVAQTGRTTARFEYMESCVAVEPAQFRRLVLDAELVVAHAGMGSVLTALECQRRLVIVPRHADLQETRNDHQVATARWLSAKPGIHVAMSEREVGTVIDQALLDPRLPGGGDDQPLRRLQAFLASCVTGA